MKNKRLYSHGQKDVLAVKIRTDEERRRRIRAVWSGLWKSVVAVALGFGLWRGGQVGWRRWVWENPQLLLGPPAVTTDGSLTREQILTAADIVEGRNILAVNLGKARAALESLPQVERAELTRIFPSTVTIIITERQPVAWVAAQKGDNPASSSRAFLIDARGTVLRSRSRLAESGSLPVISGVETGDLIPGQRTNRGEIVAALELLRLHAGSTRFQIRGIDLAKPCRLVVSDAGRGQITFALQRIAEQLGRLNQIYDLIELSHREMRTVNLVPERHVPVTFYEPEPEVSPADPAPAPAPIPEVKPPKPAPVTKPDKVLPKAGQKVPAVKAKRTPTPTPTPRPPARKPSPTNHLKKPFTLDE